MTYWTILQASIHKLQENLLNLKILMQGFQSIFTCCLHILPLVSKILTGMLGNTSLCDLTVLENISISIEIKP